MLTTGQRMVEGQHINRSLLALGNCINSLGASTKAKYVEGTGAAEKMDLRRLAALDPFLYPTLQIRQLPRLKADAPAQGCAWRQLPHRHDCAPEPC